jgi:hypothetical protein
MRIGPNDGLGANRKHLASNMSFRSAPKADFDLTRERLANVKDSRAGNFAPS